MSNDTGAIACQRHYTTFWNADTEVLGQTWSIGYADPGFTTQFVTDIRWIHRGACLACPWEGLDRPRRDPAIEDDHDHNTHPVWRSLPTLNPARGRRDSKTWSLCRGEGITSARAESTADLYR